MNGIQATVPISYDEIAAFCQRHRIRKLSLFGSVLREDFGEDSDVDVLVEFEPEARVTYLDLAGIQIELEDMIGREVDLLTPSAISKYFRQKVLDTAQIIYERK